MLCLLFIPTFMNNFAIIILLSKQEIKIYVFLVIKNILWNSIKCNKFLYVCLLEQYEIVLIGILTFYSMHIIMIAFVS